MINIFLSYSSRDKDTIKHIINNLSLIVAPHSLWHYEQTGNNNITMEEIIRKLLEVDLFILFISHNSLNSPYVQQELARAIELMKNGQIKEICPILLDNSININSDSRIPQCIKNNVVNQVKSPLNAVQIIEKVIQKY